MSALISPSPKAVTLNHDTKHSKDLDFQQKAASMPEHLALFGGPKALRSPLPDWPQHDELEEKYLLNALRSGHWWRNSGTQVRQLEGEFAAAHGCDHAVACTNGTQALELALRALDIGIGDEVIIPEMTFIGTAAAVFQSGATPIPVDVRAEDWCLDPTATQRALTAKTKAIIPVHFAGQVADMTQLQAICAPRGIAIIEDAAHAHGAVRDNKIAGSFGAAGAFSFQNFKLMTAGEGGILTMKDPAIRERAILIANCGRDPDKKSYEHRLSGFNFRLSEFQGAVLLAQLSRLAEQNEMRERGAERLARNLSGTAGFMLQSRQPDTNVHSHYMFMAWLDETALGPVDRDAVVAALSAEGLPVNRIYPGVSETPYFREALAQQGRRLEDLPASPVSRKLARTGLWMHHSALLADQNRTDDISEAFQKVIGSVDTLSAANA